MHARVWYSHLIVMGWPHDAHSRAVLLRDVGGGAAVESLRHIAVQERQRWVDIQVLA